MPLRKPASNHENFPVCSYQLCEGGCARCIPEVTPFGHLMRIAAALRRLRRSSTVCLDDTASLRRLSVLLRQPVNHGSNITFAKRDDDPHKGDSIDEFL